MTAFVASDGVELHGRAWMPDQEARAVLLIVHGVGEHSGCYDAFATRLAAAGIECHAFDHRGHGESSGPRVHVDAWKRYEMDVVEYARDVIPVRPELPFYVFGHSMGSLIALTLAISGAGRRLEGFDGWVISGVGIRPTGIAKPWLVAIARVLSRIAPRVALDLGIPGAALSHDPDVVKAYDEDPLIERKATVRWGTETLDAIDHIKAHAREITDPVLIVHGGADPLSEPSGSEWLAGQVQGAVELNVYEAALHEAHNDPDYADVVQDLVGWFERRAA